MSKSPALHTRNIAAVTLAALIALASPVRSATAQTAEPRESKVELRVTSGSLIATGSQRNFVKDAHATTAQLSWLVRPTLAVTGSFGWARSRDIASVDRPKLDVFNSDIGFEVRSARKSADRGVTFSPFMGLGAGMRSYNYRSLEVDATNNFTGYASVGGEMGIGRARLRLEARDYVSGFKPLNGAGNSDTRNDVLIVLGLRFNKKTASQEK